MEGGSKHFMPELTSEPDSKGGENKKKYIYKIKGPI
jgi:hypothetical protein